MISKLKKLKGRSLAELADRGRQKVGAMVERAGFSSRQGHVSDEEFLDSLDCGAASANELLDHFRSRDRNVFYPCFLDSQATIESLRSRFRDEEKRLIASAEKICRGKFDLLGFDDLDFGGPIPDWHLEPVSGKRSPLVHRSEIDETDAELSGDKKIVWELNRHQYFPVLGAAFWLTGDEKYARTAIDHIDDWIEKNPPRLGINWTSSLEIAYRSMSWLWALSYFLDSQMLEAGNLIKILKCLDVNARHIENNLSTYTSPNTHLTGEALALFAIGKFLPESRNAARWRQTGREILDTELDRQLRDDGGYVEQSTHYQRYTADIYLSFLIFLRSHGENPNDRLRARLALLLKFLMYAAQPDGRTPLIGDDDGGRLHFLDGRKIDDFQSTLGVGAALLGDRHLKYVAGDCSPELLWLLGPEGVKEFDTIEAVQPSVKAKDFAESGFYSARTKWGRDATFVYVDCGTHGFLNGGHAHADALSFVMSVNGVPVFVDPGTFNYTSDLAARDHFRSSAAHNCLTVNGESSSIPAGPFSWTGMANAKLIEWNVDDAQVFFRGTHDGYRRFGVDYEREMSFLSSGETRLVDKVETETTQSFEINLTLSPEVYVVSNEGMSVTIGTKAGNGRLLRIDTKLTENRFSDGWEVKTAKISPRYGALVETEKLFLKVRSDRGFAIITSFLPENV